MANGFLTGAYDGQDSFDRKYDYRSVMPQFTAEAVKENRELMDLLQSFAEKKGATLGQISLAWMMCKKPWVVPIPGSRRTERMKENAGAADVALSAEEVEILDRALDTIPMSDVFGGTGVKQR